MNHFNSSSTCIVRWFEDVKCFLGLALLVHLEFPVIFRKDVSGRSDLKGLSELPNHLRDVPPHEVLPS
jgi:hypothetical protein